MRFAEEIIMVDKIKPTAPFSPVQPKSDTRNEVLERAPARERRNRDKDHPDNPEGADTTGGGSEESAPADATRGRNINIRI